MSKKLKLTDPLPDPYYPIDPVPDPYYHGDMSRYQAHTARIVACAKIDFIRYLLPAAVTFGTFLAILALR